MAFVSNNLDFPNLTSKGTPVSADILLIADSAASNALKQCTVGSLPSSGGSGGLTWVDQNSSSATLAASHGYVCDNGATLITYTLPTTAALGDTYKVVGSSSGGWKINEATGQTIHVGLSTTTTTTGSLASSNQYDVVTVICVTANTTFICIPEVGNITIV